MVGAHVEYLKQAYLHQLLSLSLSADEVGKARFTLVYQLTDDVTQQVVARGETHMACFNYARQKPARMPQTLSNALA